MVSDYPARSAYSGDAAAKYDEVRFGSPRGRLIDLLEWSLVRRGLRALERKDSLRRVLDVPIGTGRMATRMRAAGLDVTGADVSADMIAIARRKDAANRYMVCGVEDLDLEDRSVDAVVSVRLFGHLPDEVKERALSEYRRVATRGAVVFFAGESRRLRARRQRQARNGRILDHWCPVEDSWMVLAARAAGFSRAKCIPLLGSGSETRALVAWT